jgi:hypothetical protein
MSESTGHSLEQSPLFLEIRRPEAGFHRYLIRCGRFPLAPAMLHRWLGLYARLRPLLFPPGTQPAIVIQMWHLHHNDGASVVSRNGRAWMPDFGAGVWLDEPPPRLWTPEDFLNIGPGEMLPPPVLTAIHLAAEQLDHEHAWMQLGGRGCYMEFSVSGSVPAFFETQAALYREWIEEPMIASLPFFVPLIRHSSFGSPLFAGRERHAAPIVTYIRESAEDEGVLILTRENLDRVFQSSFRMVPWATPVPDGNIFLLQGEKT